MQNEGKLRYIIYYNYKMNLLIIQVDSARDPYEFLGLYKHVSIEVANKKFKLLSRVCHPDKSDHPRADEIFKKINGDLKKKIYSI